MALLFKDTFYVFVHEFKACKSLKVQNMFICINEDKRKSVVTMTFVHG